MSVSILMCTRNGRSRLQPTIERLLGQQDCAGIEWEIVIVDNGSTDGTADYAKELLLKAPVPVTLLSEPRPGRVHGIKRGLKQCRHEFISFVDDDNWVCADWIRRIEDFMREHPEAGMVGSLNEPVFEGNQPEWFAAVAGSYACGPHAAGTADVTDRLGFLPGGGSTIRRAAWQRLLDTGFAFFTGSLPGQRGGTGEDVELGLALSANGWRIHYCAELMLRHFMPKGRMTWAAARRHAFGIGAGAVAIDPYLLSPLGDDHSRSWKDRLRRTWQWQALSKARACWHAMPSLSSNDRVGDLRTLAYERNRGALRSILETRASYTRHIETIASAPWRTSR